MLGSCGRCSPTRTPQGRDVTLRPARPRPAPRAAPRPLFAAWGRRGGPAFSRHGHGPNGRRSSQPTPSRRRGDTDTWGPCTLRLKPLPLVRGRGRSAVHRGTRAQLLFRFSFSLSLRAPCASGDGEQPAAAQLGAPPPPQQREQRQADSRSDSAAPPPQLKPEHHHHCRAGLCARD